MGAETGGQRREEGSAKEHILVCLSSAPSNAKIVRTAARMADAFGAVFTALYVQTPDSAKMTEADRKRLQENIRLAERLGAAIATTYGDDVSYQITEFARLSAVTAIVIGRSNVLRRHFWSKPVLTERLTALAPNVDIYIIPDLSAEHKYYAEKRVFVSHILPSVWDVCKTLLLLAAATAVGTVFHMLSFTEANIITIYILGVLLTALVTKNHACSVISSLASVLLFNFFFTEPRLTFHAYEHGYPVTFAIMLTASLLTGTLANKLKDHAKQSAQAAFRTKVLFDTNQLLQKAGGDHEIINITASQLVKLLNRDVIAYPETDGKLSRGYLFRTSEETAEADISSFQDRAVAQWVFENRKRAGATTDVMPEASCLYLAIRINSRVYGVVGIYLDGRPLDPFENSVMLSILGECALAIDNSRNAKARETAAVMARNEQLRANLLRTISHDLRTPLTSISGNASNLLSNYECLDRETRTQIFNDIYDDSMWLIGVVENLLSVTRMEEGRVQLHLTTELIDEVIAEALRHTDRRIAKHRVCSVICEELMLVRVDARLIMQVIINLVDNAVKYTPPGSEIVITAERKEEWVAIRIADNGPGIPDAQKEHVFEMFFTGENRVADSHRSLGLGLCLCRSIVRAHGGEITLSDNVPSGCVFTFTLPSGEVEIHE